MTQRIPHEVAAQVAGLFVAESEAVFSSALRAAQGDRGVAEDLIQETFQTAAEQWDTIAGYSSARKRAWLRRVAINKAIDGYRKTGRRMQQLRAVADVILEAPSAEEVVLTKMQAERCLKVIGDMPEMRRRVAYLRFHERWTNREIAAELGISPGTVGKHVSDARADFKKALPEMTFADGPDTEGMLTGRWRHESEG